MRHSFDGFCQSNRWCWKLNWNAAAAEKRRSFSIFFRASYITYFRPQPTTRTSSLRFSRFRELRRKMDIRVQFRSALLVLSIHKTGVVVVLPPTLLWQPQRRASHRIASQRSFPLFLGAPKFRLDVGFHCMYVYIAGTRDGVIGR